MGTGDKDENEIGRSNCTDNLDHGSSSVTEVWQLANANPANAIGLFPAENLLPVCSTSCAPAPMVDSFGQTLWHDPTNIQNPGFSGYASSRMGIGNINHASLRDSMDRPLDMMWNPPDLLPKGNGLFPPNMPVFLPQSLSEFPADSGFIERAARFSCFGGGNLGDMMNHSLGVPESMGLYSQAGRVMRGPQAIYGGNVVKPALSEKPATNGANAGGPPKDPIFAAEHSGRFKNDGKNGNFLRSHDENKQNIPGSSNVSDEARSSGGNDQDEQPCQDDKGREIPLKGSNTKKRKRMGQDLVPDHSSRPEKSDEAADENADNKKKEEPNSNSAGKQGKQNSDPPKDGYIHVRARRGQATNSHSLAERVRREKISERMKFLQDLVPGCNKVTGKAVMLDEIINYVQSLQRQVEFLSMKLATVNPRLDFNIEELLAKEALHTRPGPSSCVPFPQDMPMVYPNLLHQSASGHVIQPVNNPSNFFPRSMNPQFPPVNGGFKPQENHVWEGDLHNVIQMSCGTGVPTNDQDETESQSGGNTKVEP